MTEYHSVVSPNGTTISYSSQGAGPGLVVVPGNNRMAHNYDRLAGALAHHFRVSVIDRRGRGGSGTL